MFGYRSLLVWDGAAMLANPGVNPSLTITALAATCDEPRANRCDPGAAYGAASMPATQKTGVA